MITPNVAQSISAVACAIIVATLLVPLTPAVTIAKADTKAETVIMSSDAKGDRQALRTQGTACSALGWPHYEQHCIFDRSRPADEVRTVRVINLR